MLQLPLYLLFFLFLYCSCSSTRTFRDEGGKKLPLSVASARHIRIGGIKQYVCIRGENKNNPLLLILHGGPGNLTMPLYMHYNAALEKHFVVVYWDQRGAGKSYHKSIPTQSMTLQQFISDTHELVSLLKNRFDKQKLFLMGHSWGSLLGMHVIKNYPDDFYAFISVGQYVQGIDNERLSYEFVWKAAREKNDTAALQTLQRIGSPVNGIYPGGLQAMIQQRGLLEKFGGIIHRDIRGQHSSIYRKSKEYHILDLLGARKGLVFSFPMAQAVLPVTNLFWRFRRCSYQCIFV